MLIRTQQLESVGYLSQRWGLQEPPGTEGSEYSGNGLADHAVGAVLGGRPLFVLLLVGIGHHLVVPVALALLDVIAVSCVTVADVVIPTLLACLQSVGRLATSICRLVCCVRQCLIWK